MGARSQVDYLILKPQLPIHRRPSTSSRTLGQLKRGQIVSGWPQESWLLLAEKGTTPKSTTGGWVLVDASCLGLGQQAQAQWPVPKELRPFSEAVVVEWTKFPARHVEYQVEWADESEKDKITVARSRETMTMARVHELPADSRLIFRLTAKVYTAPPEQGGEIFTEAVGPWEEAETGATIEKLEEGNLCCLADCRGFVGERGEYTWQMSPKPSPCSFEGFGCIFRDVFKVSLTCSFQELWWDVHINSSTSQCRRFHSQWMIFLYAHSISLAAAFSRQGVDPLANLRGRCMDCSCHGFVLAEYGERPRTGDTLEEVSCRRCSCSCVRHFIIGSWPQTVSLKLWTHSSLNTTMHTIITLP